MISLIINFYQLYRVARPGQLNICCSCIFMGDKLVNWCDLSFLYIINVNIQYGQSSAKLPITRSLGHSVNRSLGHSITQSLGYSVTRSIGHSVITQSLGHSVTRSLGYSVTRTLGHSVTRSLGHSVTRSPCHHVIHPVVILFILSSLFSTLIRTNERTDT